MKNINLLSIFGSLILSINLNAAPISIDEAKNVAKNWMLEKSGQELEIDDSDLGATSNQSDAYRIIKLKPKGWVIVSSDDVSNPIIGYGYSKTSNGQNPAFNGWMKGIEEQINSAKNSLGAMSNEEQQEAQEIQQAWSKYKVTTEEFKNNNTLGATGADDFDYVVRPLLWMGSATNTENQGIQWNQGAFYNTSCPVDADGPNGHVWAGCGATAISQIMRYHRYPAQGNGSNSYTDDTYGEQSADFGATTYDWASMPLKLTSENNTVAQVLYQSAVAVNMDFGTNYSWSYTSSLANALHNYFRYDISELINRNNFLDADWKNIIKHELNSSRPIIYSGADINNEEGHSFNIDGYDSDDFYHLNWGWSGYDNGKFTIDNLIPGGSDYSYEQQAIIVVQDDTSPTITISDENLSICVMNAVDVDDASKITEMKVKFLTSLSCYNKNISDISSLQHLTALTSLSLDYNQITDITVLQNMTALTTLNLNNNQISDITALQNLTGLKYLYLGYNLISNIEPLHNLSVLNYVSLAQNYITDFTPVDHLANDVVSGKDYQYTLLAPTELIFSDKTQTSVTLHWIDHADNETGYKIYRNGVYLETIASDSTSYADSALTKATTYTYTVKATLE